MIMTAEERIYFITIWNRSALKRIAKASGKGAEREGERESRIIKRENHMIIMVAMIRSHDQRRKEAGIRAANLGSIWFSARFQYCLRRFRLIPPSALSWLYHQLLFVVMKLHHKKRKRGERNGKFIRIDLIQWTSSCFSFSHLIFCPNDLDNGTIICLHITPRNWR